MDFREIKVYTLLGFVKLFIAIIFSVNQFNYAVLRFKSFQIVYISMSDSRWPVVEGRYVVGNPDSPIAICTMASVDMDFPRDKVAIWGSALTENLGVEKIIRNIVSNKNIKYLVVCGKISKGHFVGQALESLIKSGVDKDMRIIGAKGAMPVLKNVSLSEIEEFRNQIKIIDLTGETSPTKVIADIENVMNMPAQVEQESRAARQEVPKEPVKEIPAENPKGIPKPERPQTVKIPIRVPEEMTVEAVIAEESDAWKQDDLGFFLIKADKENRRILAEYYSNDSKLRKTLTGKSAQAIYKKLIGLGLVSSHVHAAYLGKELAKAEMAIKFNLSYVQDNDLQIPVKSVETQKKYLKLTTITRTYLCGGSSICTSTDKIADDREYLRTISKLGLCRIFG